MYIFGFVRNTKFENYVINFTFSYTVCVVTRVHQNLANDSEHQTKEKKDPVNKCPKNAFFFIDQCIFLCFQKTKYKLKLYYLV